MRFWAVILLFTLGQGVCQILAFSPRAEPAAGQPSQRLLDPGEVKPWSDHGVIFQPLARYQVTARILSRKIYHLDELARVCPMDLALGWNRMSDPRIYKRLYVSQGERWYHYYLSDRPPIPPDEINSSSANTHVIPADSHLCFQLFGLREDDVVALTGYLVKLRFPNGRTWTSSLSRTDIGNHSCEIMWVDSVTALGQ